MNDDFLHRIRVEPPADFLVRLKTRLDRQAPPAPKPQRTMLRALAWFLLFGGSAFAITLLMVNGIPEAARNLIWAQHHQPATNSMSDSDATRLTNERRRGHPAFAHGLDLGAERVAGQERLSGQARSAAGARGSGAPQASAGVSATSPSVSGWASLSSSNANIFVTPKALHGYTTALTDSVFPRGIAVSVKDVDTTTEALEQLCTDGSGTKGSSLPQAAIATRRITRAEFETCTRTIVSVSEVPLGHQAIVLARSKAYGAVNLSPHDIFLALAAEVPDPTRPEEFIPNPYTTWSRVDFALENEPIEVIGPPLSSTTGMTFSQLLLHAGCDTFPSIVALRQTDAAQYERICTTIRKDGIYVEMPEFRIAQRLQLNPNTVGILGYASLSIDTGLAVSLISGIAPTLETILTGAYPASRPLYLYVSPRHTSWLAAYSLSRFAVEVGFLPETYSIVPVDPTRTNDPLHNNPIKLLDLKQ